MSGNKSAKGGCIQIVNSEVSINNSTFRDNVGLQGGVIFIISNSIVEVNKSVLEQNIAVDGGILYAMSNKF